MSSIPTSLSREASFGKILITLVLLRSSLLIRSIWFDVENLRSAVSRLETYHGSFFPSYLFSTTEIIGHPHKKAVSINYLTPKYNYTKYFFTIGI